ncbi:sensor histidine kinase [Aminipila luticellarii]|uniref:GHKL domain-containing protein n=1 Tax=Aminipila luticellarii TaxID=2507160 RepID=A0A410PWM1_9FIRM|nr:GHKL domain-containing protein [Aminipila luticellarii]QAT43343.1 GHKL domain-containing protein [Aminipila luticellarii]
MTLWQSCIGTLIENSASLFLMSILNPIYTKSKGKFITAISAAAFVVTFGEYMQLPVLARFIINYGFTVFFYSMLFRRKLQYTFFEFLFAMGIGIGIEFLLVALQNFFWPGRLEVWQSFVHLGILLSICMGCTRFSRTAARFQAFYETYRQSFYFVTISVFIALFLELFIWDTARYSLYENMGLVCSFALMWLGLNFYLLKVLIADERKKALVAAYRQYERATENLLDCLYSDKHEYKRHLQTILRMCETEDTTKTEIMTYIMEIEKDKEEETTPPPCFHTGNGLINGLIYAKVKEAEDNHIKLALAGWSKAPAFPCLSYELIELLGNLLDNALEYLKEQPEHKVREIYLDIGCKQGKAFIKIKNSYYVSDSETECFAQKGFTTKTGSVRGYGLYNVKQIVAKYKGEFKIFTDDEYISICIYFKSSGE